MTHRPVTLASILALVCGGCTHTCSLDRQGEGCAVIPSHARVYVAMPEAAHFSGRDYPQSGVQTRDAIVQAILPRVAEVSPGALPEDPEAALRSAREWNATHAIVPAIEHWEDRATEWSGKPDRIIIDVRIRRDLSGPSGLRGRAAPGAVTLPRPLAPLPP